MLIVGAGGQLGEAMTSALGGRERVVAVTRSELDVTSLEAVRALVARVAPRVILNCSAYTNVDKSEQEPLQALQVNAMAVRALARAADDLNAVLVHYSTDFVFDGKTDRPYTESDPVNPRGTYASSKLLGEWLAMDTPRHYVLRVESLFGGAKAHSSVDKILANLRQGATVRAFVDRTVSPSFVDDVIVATMSLLEREAPFGLYHCVNSGWTNWAALARELAELVGTPAAPIEEIRMADAGLLANRPLFAALSNAKLLAAGVEMPTWQDALARYVAKTTRLSPI
ncbi:MAG: dTDP-4-dehydrorhamnose reductase [Acidobacteriota bacterium]